MTKIVIAGASGRMGRVIADMASQDKEFAVTYLLDPNFKGSMSGAGIAQGNDMSKIQETDALIDFTSPVASLELVACAAKYKKACVIGTTGYSHEQEGIINRLSAEIPIVKASNMSLGVNILAELVSRAAKLLDPMNMSVEESHHRHKKDAPSGTAKFLGETLAHAMNLDSEKYGVYDGGANISEEEAKRKIFFNWRRSSEIVGEHTVYLGGWGEELRLGHAAHDRAPFAAGALRAATWVVKQKPGLYSMRSVLGLEPSDD